MESEAGLVMASARCRAHQGSFLGIEVVVLVLAITGTRGSQANNQPRFRGCSGQVRWLAWSPGRGLDGEEFMTFEGG